MKLSFSLFCKNLLLNLLIATQICASTLCGVIAVAVISKAYSYYNLTESASLAYVYMPENTGVYYTDSAVAEFTGSGEINLSRSRNELVWSYKATVSDAHQAYLLSEYKIDNVYTFGPIISEVMKTQLKKGEWYSDISENDVIECVIVGDVRKFPIGSFIDGAEFGVTPNEDKTGIVFAMKNKYQFKVVGTCGESAKTLDFGTVVSPAENLDIEYLFQTISYRKPGFFESINNPENKESQNDTKPSITLFCSATAFNGNDLGDYEKKYSGNNALFTFSDNVSQHRRSQILEKLKEEAGVTDIASLRQKELLVAKNTVAQYLPIMLCFLSMVIIGVICVAVLNMIKNEKTLKAYIICGMSVKKGIGILLGYTCILLILAALLTLASWTLISLLGLIPWAQMASGAPSVLFAFVNFLIAWLLIMITSVPILKNYEIRGTEK